MKKRDIYQENRCGAYLSSRLTIYPNYFNLLQNTLNLFLSIL